MILIILEAPCTKEQKAQISVWDIESSDLYSFLSRLRSEGKYVPTAAAMVYYHVLDKMPRILSQIREMGMEATTYFVTPYTVAREDDYVIVVRECLDSLSIAELEKLFEIFRVRDRVYDLLEQDFYLAVICMNRKLLRVLDLDYYIPTSKPIIIVSDVYTSPKSNVLVITPTHFLSRRITKSPTYGPEFCMSILSYLSKAMAYLHKHIGKQHFRELLRSPPEFFQIVFSLEVIERIVGRKGVKLDAFFG